jgi:hypothetical protein
MLVAPEGTWTTLEPPGSVVVVPTGPPTTVTTDSCIVGLADVLGGTVTTLVELGGTVTVLTETGLLELDGKVDVARLVLAGSVITLTLLGGTVIVVLRPGRPIVIPMIVYDCLGNVVVIPDRPPESVDTT